MKYPCVGTPIPIVHEGKTYYIPHIWVSRNEGIYAPQRMMYEKESEANAAAQAAVDKIIKEQVKK